MQVLIDLRWMIPGYTGGVEHHTRGLLNTLLQIDSTNEYTVLLPSTARFDFDLRGKENFHFMTSDGPGYYLSKLMLSLRKRKQKPELYTNGSIVVQARRIQAQIAISPAGVIAPDLYPLKNLLIVPDIQHEFLPEYFAAQELEARRLNITGSIRRADYICTVSNYSRQTIIERLGIPDERVSVAHLGVDSIFRHPGPGVEQVLPKYGLELGSYLYYPANTWRHKNHSLMLKALHILRANSQLKPLFVCTGTPKEAHDDLLALCAQLDLQDQFRFLGYCPREEIPGLYRGAAALVFPSFYEGFGMPILEAMWSACPVICSNATSLPEVAGDAALMIDPNDPDDLAEAIRRLLTNPSLREELIQRGRERAQEFSWLKFTTEILWSMNRLPRATPA